MLHTFISYSWKNAVHRDSLVRRLSDAGLRPSWDERFIPVGDEINSHIVKELKRSDVLITHLTTEAMESKYVREELTRAHHQSLKIYAIVQEEAIPKLPWFLETSRQLHYATEEQFLQRVDLLVHFLLEDAKRVHFWRAQSFSQQLNMQTEGILQNERFPAQDERWLLELAASVLENTKGEMEALQNGSYDALVSKESNYLFRAKHVFENAANVYAVSIDSVSDFWVSDATRDQRHAYDYLLTQPSSTKRLFVFAGPDSAHDYTTILNAHARKYDRQNQGRGYVYLCSAEAYKPIVEQWASHENDHSTFNCDFAVLEYKQGEETSLYKATLNGETFQVKRADRRNSWPRIQEQRVAEIFREWENLQPGEINPHHNVMRWQIDLQSQPQMWAGKLQTLFGDRHPDVLHLVFFAEGAFDTSEAKAHFREIVQDIKSTLEEMRERSREPLLVKDVWFGEHRKVEALEPRTRGRILSDYMVRYPYLLMMRFEDSEHLKTWYELDKHSHIRRRLHETFNPSFVTLYSALDAILKNHPHDVQVAQMYEEIELDAVNYMRRDDFAEADTILDVVRRRPFRPKMPWTF